MPPEIRVIGVEGMPEVQPGDDLSAQMMDAADGQGTPFEAGDIIVVTQKVVSKTEASGSTGSKATVLDPGMLEASIPALAH